MFPPALRRARGRLFATLGLSLVAACTGADTLSAPSLTPATQPSEARLRTPGLSGVHVYARYGGTCILDAQGVASCWGWNREGRHGDGTLTDQPLPTPVSGGLTFVSLAAADHTTCGLTTDGAVYCWGADGDRLPEQTDYRLEPKRVTGNDVFAAMSSSDWNACGITTRGDTKCWPLFYTDVFTPQSLAGAPALLSFSTPGSTSTLCGLAARGKAYCWGANSFGQAGIGSPGSDLPSPTAVVGGIRFEQLTGGFLHTCGVDRRGTAYCWGYNYFGGLGDGTTTDRSAPTPVSTTLQFTQISGGNSHSCGLTKDGSVYCWGSGYSGQLGLGLYVQTTAPTTPVPGGLQFKEISAGGTHSCGVTRGDQVYCWGDNSWGQLGDGTTISRTEPTLVQQ